MQHDYLRQTKQRYLMFLPLKPKSDIMKFHICPTNIIIYYLNLTLTSQPDVYLWFMKFWKYQAFTLFLLYFTLHKINILTQLIFLTKLSNDYADNVNNYEKLKSPILRSLKVLLLILNQATFSSMVNKFP